MHVTARASRAHVLLRLVLAASAAAAIPAMAQSHESNKAGYALRSSTVASRAIDPRSAREHGITPDADTGVLNAVVLRQPSGMPVAADVTATARSLTGRTQTIPMKEVGANGGVSYVGTYSFAPREVLDFTVTARPRTERALRIELTYRERMWASPGKEAS